MATDVLYISTLVQYCGTQRTVTTINHFQPVGGAIDKAQEVLDRVRDVLLPAINASQGGHVSNYSLDTRCGTSGGGIAFEYLTGGGQRAVTDSVILPPFLTATARWQTGSTQFGMALPLITKGYTRFSGLIDNDISNGRLSADWISTYGDDIVAAWLDSYEIAGVFYSPAIHVNRTEGAAEWRIRWISGFNGWKVGTQNTRKEN